MERPNPYKYNLKKEEIAAWLKQSQQPGSRSQMNRVAMATSSTGTIDNQVVNDTNASRSTLPSIREIDSIEPNKRKETHSNLLCNQAGKMVDQIGISAGLHVDDPRPKKRMQSSLDEQTQADHSDAGASFGKSPGGPKSINSEPALSQSSEPNSGLYFNYSLSATLAQKPRNPKISRISRNDYYCNSHLIERCSSSASCDYDPSLPRYLLSISEVCPYLGGSPECCQQLDALGALDADDIRTASSIKDLNIDTTQISFRDLTLLYLLDQARINNCTKVFGFDQVIGSSVEGTINFWDISNPSKPEKMGLHWEEFHYCLERFVESRFKLDAIPRTRPERFIPPSFSRPRRPIIASGMREFRDIHLLLRLFHIDIESLGEDDFDTLVSLPHEERAVFLRNLVSKKARKLSSSDSSEILVARQKNPYTYNGPVDPRYSSCSLYPRPPSRLLVSQTSTRSLSLDVPTITQNRNDVDSFKRSRCADEHMNNSAQRNSNLGGPRRFTVSCSRLLKYITLGLLPTFLLAGGIAVLIFGVGQKKTNYA